MLQITRGTWAGSFWLCLAVLLLCMTPTRAAAISALVPEDHTFPAPQVGIGGTISKFAPNGFGITAWVERRNEGTSQIDVSSRPPGGEWSAVQSFTPTANPIYEIVAAVNSQGEAGLTWDEVEGSTDFIAHVTTKTATGSFDTPEQIANGINPQVGIDAKGNITLIYGLNVAMGAEHVRVAPAGQPLLAAPEEKLETPDECGDAETSLAVAPSGEAIVAIECENVTFALRKSGEWKSSTPFFADIAQCPETVSVFYSNPSVAIDSDGHVAGVVEKTIRNASCESMFGETSESNSIVLALQAGGEMKEGPKVAESGPSFDEIPSDPVSGPDVGIGGGSVIVSWAAGGATLRSQPATRTYAQNGTATPGEVELIQTSNDTSPPDLSINSAGQSLLTWVEAVGASQSVFAAFAPAGEHFGSPLLVNPSSIEAAESSGSLDEAGDGLITYVQGGKGSEVVHARGFDSTPPKLTNVSIPTTATAGSPATFAAQAFDVWGPVTFSWNFGDGSGSGATPSHSFSLAGAHTVTVTASDSVGNTVAQSESVTVAPASAPAPGLPILTNVSLTNSIFKVSPKPTAIAARSSKNGGKQGKTRKKGKHKVPAGTTLRFSLNEQASVSIKFERSVAGRLSGGKCSKPTKKQAKHLSKRERCTRFEVVGKLTRKSIAGINSVPFSGRIGSRPLAAGTYRAVLVASSGENVSASKTLQLKVAG